MIQNGSIAHKQVDRVSPIWPCWRHSCAANPLIASDRNCLAWATPDDALPARRTSCYQQRGKLLPLAHTEKRYYYQQRQMFCSLFASWWVLVVTSDLSSIGAHDATMHQGIYNSLVILLLQLRSDRHHGLEQSSNLCCFKSLTVTAKFQESPRKPRQFQVNRRIKPCFPSESIDMNVKPRLNMKPRSSESQR